MLQEFPEENIESLATGAWILGTGGGGNPYLSTLNLRRLYAEGARVQVLQPSELADDDMVAVVSGMGAPLVGQERLKDPRHMARAVELMEDYLGRPFRAIMALEIGGANALSPFLAAALLGRPVVNADCMGRAYPEAQMTSFAIGGLSMFPLSLVDVRDNEVIVTRAESWKWMEKVSRAVCTAVGSTAATCKAPRTGREVKDWGIHHTITQATELGRVVLEARARHDDPVAAVLDHAKGKQIFRGKIVDVDRTTTGGFLRGKTVIEGIDADRGATLELAFQNEWAVAFRDGAPVAMTPDLLCLLDSVSGSAIGTESARLPSYKGFVSTP